MAIWYVDPEGGNDVNDGTTFANRKKTIGSIAAGSLTAGDQVRVMASRPRQLIGNATWTDGSGTITLDPSLSGLTQVIDSCDVAWLRTGGATSISTSSSINVNSREGAAAITIGVPASGTGKLAYKTLSSTLDLSAYMGVSMPLLSSSANFPAAGTLVMDLCSDATGDVPLKTISLDFGVAAALTLANTTPFLILATDTGLALPSGVNSVALRLTSAYGTAVTLTFDNMIATKGWNDPNHISHLSLIAKDTAAEPEYYPIMSIVDTTLVVGGILEKLRGIGTFPARPYSGTTETVPTYFRLPTRPAWSLTNATLTKGGAVGNRIVISGGWDRTAMSSQSGLTVWTNCGAISRGFFIGSLSSVEVSNFAGAHMSSGGFVMMNSGIGDIKIQLAFMAGCYNQQLAGVDTNSGNGLAWDLSVTIGWTHNGGSTAPLGGCGPWQANGGTQSPLKLYMRRIHGRAGDPTTGTMILPNGSRDQIDTEINFIDNNAGYAMASSNSGLQNVWVRNCVMKNNGTGDFQQGSIQLTMFLERCSFQVPPLLGQLTGSLVPAIAINGIGSRLLVNAFGGNTADNREYSQWYTWLSDTLNRHPTPGAPTVGASWKVSPLNTDLVTSTFPTRKSLVKVACKGGQQRTVNVWLMRDNLGLTLGLMTLQGYIAGVDTQRVPMTGPISTWQQVAITFTPTEDGMVEIWGYAYGGTTFNGWFSDVSVI